MTTEKAIERLLALRKDKIRKAKFYGESGPFQMAVAAAMEDATALKCAITMLEKTLKDKQQSFQDWPPNE